MNLTVGATYIVLGGLIILLLVLLLNRKKEVVEINDAILRPEELEKHAVEIAWNHTVSKDSRALRWLSARIKENFKFIQSVNKKLSAEVDNMFPTASAAEWLLDNFYVIEEQVREILHLLSKNRHNKLPVLDSGYLKGYPRVFAVALELVAHTDGKIDEDRIVGFLRAYQSHRLLSMNELWAFAIMLKIALLENIRYICEKIVETQEDWHKAEDFADIIARCQENNEPLPLDALAAYFKGAQTLKSSFVEHLILKLRKQGSKATEIINHLDSMLAEHNSSVDALIALEHQIQASRQISMGNSITSLRSISSIDWADIFEALSSVEQILREDPSGIYPRMDFESRDYYRHQIEKLAASLNSTENRIAMAAVECAEEASALSDARDPICHVGYYIIGKGKGKLKEKTGYRARGLKAACEKISHHCARLYIGSIVLTTLVVSGLFAHYSGSRVSGIGYACYFILTMIVVFIPVSELAIPLINCVVSRFRQPVMIPKLELKEGIPEESATMVIIPTLLPNEKRVRELIERLEIFYLANKEKNLYFALVGDYKDASSKELPEDGKIISAALRGVEELNRRYGQEERDIFYFFHRHRQYNESQGKWMGWERKRGAIVELVELLRGSENTSYSIVSCDVRKLPFIKYIITIDADTSLPMGTARRLIGTMLHPMNKPVVDHKKGLVVEGYGLLQPRISVDVVSANASQFSRIY